MRESLSIWFGLDQPNTSEKETKTPHRVVSTPQNKHAWSCYHHTSKERPHEHLTTRSRRIISDTIQNMSTKSKISNDGTRMEFDYQTLSYTVSNVKLRSFKLRAFSNIICWPTSQLKEKCKHHTPKKREWRAGRRKWALRYAPLSNSYQRALIALCWE